MQHIWILWTAVGLSVFLLLTVLLTSYVCFYMVFYVPKKKKRMTQADIDAITTAEPAIPSGDIYEIYREDMVNWTHAIRAMNPKTFEITSEDGLTLRARFYERSPDAPVEILFHGYRGSAERDLNGGVFRCAALGHSALLVDHRASGLSDGKVITFGIKEAEDCLLWIDFVIKHFGRDTSIFLGGVSMGAATVMMASGKDLPSNVKGILADCGYSSAKEIIKKVVREMKLPDHLLYPFIKLGARLYGGFDLDATSPVEAVRRSRVPIIFLHGDTDDFVPCDMSKACFDACASPKAFSVIHGAGHGLAYPVDKEGYVAAVRAFYEEQGVM